MTSTVVNAGAAAGFAHETEERNYMSLKKALEKEKTNIYVPWTRYTSSLIRANVTVASVMRVHTG